MSSTFEHKEKIIKIRKQEIEIDGKSRLIVMIRDFSDSVKF